MRRVLAAVVLVCACGRPDAAGDSAATDSGGGPPPPPLGAPAGATTAAAPPAAAQPATQSGTAPVVAQGDTLIARVAVVGSDPATFVTLRPATGGRAMSVEGNAAQLLRSVSGADVWIRGSVAPEGRVRVDDFLVRRVNGAPVHDGIVVVTETSVGVRRDGFTRLIPNAPPGLRALAGKRVWVTHAQDGVAPSYGVVE